ncbi:MAG: DUF2207 domain-containing protein [Bacteroidales bacterium]|nr:DUF2207 domain-containing protein [Bacteroidales bacterium]
MKRLLIIAAVLLGTAVLHAQEIRSIDIDVYLDEEGNACIVQNWDVTVVRGTEWYIPIGNLNGSTVRGLTVEENGEQFIDEGRSWDTERTLSQKAGRCGIVDKGKDGVELCWGQGSMGDHKWKASFVVLGLVQSLQDYDAFNFMFVNPGLVAPPQHASICFRRLSGDAFSADSTRFWFFGCEGESVLREDGTIFFETDRPMPGNGKLIAMMRFEKGVFTPENVKDFKFEKMQKKAFKGSTYSTKSTPKYDFWDIVEMIIGGGFLLMIAALVLGLIYAFFQDQFLKLTGHQWKKSVFGSTKPNGWAREAPFKGDIPIAVHLLTDGSRLLLSTHHPERRIGAYFIKWISEGLVTPIKADGNRYNLKFPSELPDFADTCETNLFRRAMEAAGSNLLLEKDELKNWAEVHYKAMTNWPDSVARTGKSKFSAIVGDKTEEAANLLRFKNFLSEFTLSKEREVPEVTLWGQYLVFAQLFGIADKVSSGLAKLYPTQFAEYAGQYGLDSMTMRDVIHTCSYSTSSAYRSAFGKAAESNSSSSGSSGGFGGHSSFGGGGGFSGGGFGGGSR